MRPRIWRPFSSTTRARMEPPSLTREPRGFFCVVAVEDITLQAVWHQEVSTGQITKVWHSALRSSVATPKEVQRHPRSHHNDEAAYPRAGKLLGIVGAQVSAEERAHDHDA